MTWSAGSAVVSLPGRPVVLGEPPGPDDFTEAVRRMKFERGDH